MTTIISIPDKYVEMAIKLTGKYNPKEAILSIIERAYKELYGKEKESNTAKERYQQRSKTSSYQPDRATSHDTDNREELIKRAKQYRDKIIKEQGFITSEQLERIAKKFGVSATDLIDDLVMKETNKYYPYC